MIKRMIKILTKVTCMALIASCILLSSKANAISSIPNYESSESSIQISYTSSYASEDNCPIERFKPGKETCWFCPLFRVLFNTASTIALKAYNELSDDIVKVVMVGFAIWLSICILKHIASFEVKDPRKMLQEILLQAFKVFFVVVILKGAYFQVMQLTLEPVFNTGMTFVQSISGNKKCPSSASYMQGIVGYKDKFDKNSHGGLPYTMGANIICSIKATQDSVGEMVAYGKQAWCVAWGPKAFWVFPHLGYMITSIVIVLGGLILMFSFPWCLVDCVIQMSIATALAPAAIGAWAFKSTQRYLKMIWDFFMNAMFNFVFLSIVLYIIMTVVSQFMGALSQRGGGGYDFLVDPINGLAYWGVTGLKLIVVCLIGWVFLDEGKSFADKFAKSANTGGVGRQVGAQFAQAGSKVGKTAFKAGMTLGGAALQVGDHFLGSKIRRGINTARKNWAKGGTAIKDSAGNIIGYERTNRNFIGKKVTRRVMIGKDGKEVWSKEKQSIRAEISNKIKDKFNSMRRDTMSDHEGLSLKQTVDENGNISKEYYRTNLLGRQVLVNKEQYDSEGKMIAREHHRRNILGRKVILRDELDQNGNWQMSKTKHNVRMEILSGISSGKVQQFAQRNMVVKERDLSARNERAQFVSSDQFLSVRTVRDGAGNVERQEFAFRPNIEKYMVKKDGTINMDTLNTIIKDGNFDKETVMQAASMVILKQRGVNLDNKFVSRDIGFDENGGLVIKQVNRDDSVTEIKLNMGGPNGNQAFTEVKQTASNGAFTIKKSNGIQTCEISTDRNGKQVTDYGWTDEYLRRHKYAKPLNRNGQFANGMDEKAAMFGFDKADYDRHVNQVITGKKQRYTTSGPQSATTDGENATQGNNPAGKSSSADPKGGHGRTGEPGHEMDPLVELRTKLSAISDHMSELQNELNQLQNLKAAGAYSDEVKAEIDAKILAINNQMRAQQTLHTKFSADLKNLILGAGQEPLPDSNPNPDNL